jgi:hypothetical protein
MVKSETEYTAEIVWERVPLVAVTVAR